MSTKIKRNFLLRWLIVIMVIFFVAIIIIVIGYFSFEYKYRYKIYPGVSIGKTEIGGLTFSEVEKIINSKINLINQEGLPFYYHNQTATLIPLAVSINADLGYQIIDFHTDESLDLVYNYGRQGSFRQRLHQKIQAALYGFSYPLNFSYNKDEIKKFLTKNFSHFETPAQNARLVYNQKPYSNTYIFYIENEKYGQIIDYSQAISNFEENLQNLDTNTINLEAKIDYPNINKENCLNIESQASQIIANAPVKLMYKHYNWSIDKQTLVGWLQIKKDELKEESAYIGLDLKIVDEYLATTISPVIDIKPIEAKFEISNDKVSEFQASRDGLIFDSQATAAIIEQNLLQGKSENIILITEEIKSQSRTEDINDLGIKEKIGTGHSNFSGSPPNRRHNIDVGATAVNGTLIKPGDEFSLLAVLGETNAEAGYLPELVIKEGKTIPEYGGGLCQIGTTMFRATLDSGLPVTMRRNHSYRVSYYEPAGTDATIYDPWPNYKFLNDTPYHILILSQIEGDDLYFDFWSTEDGRITSSTYPTIYNITKPGPTKIIETLDLKPGDKKCTEHAHNGADAFFDYQIKYPNGKIDNTRFKSHYVPWREVCLLGVEKLTEEISSSTSEEISEN